MSHAAKLFAFYGLIAAVSLAIVLGNDNNASTNKTKGVVKQAAGKSIQSLLLTDLALQPVDLPSSAQIISQDEFEQTGYGLVDEFGHSLVINYLRGYQVQAHDSVNGFYISNYVYQFASTADAQTEFARWQKKLANVNSPQPLEILSTETGAQGISAIYQDLELGIPLHWLVVVRNRYLSFVTGYAGQQVFEQITSTLLNR